MRRLPLFFVLLALGLAACDSREDGPAIGGVYTGDATPVFGSGTVLSLSIPDDARGAFEYSGTLRDVDLAESFPLSGTGFYDPPRITLDGSVRPAIPFRLDGTVDDTGSRILLDGGVVLERE
jgi:hypothetical protein